MARVDKIKLQAAETRLREWMESLPIEQEAQVLFEWLGSKWERGSGWLYQDDSVESPEVETWDNLSWELDWWFGDEYDCDGHVLKLTISWDYIGGNPYDSTSYAHAETWGVGDAEVSRKWADELAEYGFTLSNEGEEWECWEYEFSECYSGCITLTADRGRVYYTASLTDIAAAVVVYSGQFDDLDCAGARLEDEYERWSAADEEACNE